MKLKYNAKAHGYWLDGKRCKSPSAIAKVPDDTNALTGWKLRQVALGIASDPDKFLTEVSAHSDDKESLDGICQQAIDAAGGGSGRDRGSALHLITEKLDAGIDLFDTPMVVETRRVWNQLLTDYGLTVVHSEGVIVHPDMRIAGRFDRIVRDGNGQQYVLDIKGGADADKYVHAHCVQLWLYASAPYMAELPVGDTDFEVTEFAPMPAVSQELGLIAHIPIEGEARIIGIDIAAGGRCFEDVIKPIWGWRARKDLVSEFNAAIPAPLPAEPDHPHGDLIERINAIKANEAASLTLRTQWPAGVPTPKNADQWTDGHMQPIIDVLRNVERDHSMPFMPEPFEKPATTLNVAEPEPVVDLEGDCNEELAAALQARIAALPREARDVLNGWAFAANASGSSLSLKQLPSERRCQIVRICVAALDSVDDIDDKMRGFLELNLGAERVQPGFTTGAVLGSLTLSESVRLAEIID